MTETVVTVEQRALFGVLSLGLLWLVVRMVRRRDFELRHGILWLPVAGAALLVCIVPEVLTGFSDLLGFHLASNAAMSLSIMGLLFVTFLQSVGLARAKKDVRDLAQRMALLEARERESRKA